MQKTISKLKIKIEKSKYKTKCLNVEKAKCVKELQIYQSKIDNIFKENKTSTHDIMAT